MLLSQCFPRPPRPSEEPCWEAIASSAAQCCHQTLLPQLFSSVLLHTPRGNSRCSSVSSLNSQTWLKNNFSFFEKQTNPMPLLQNRSVKTKSLSEQPHHDQPHCPSTNPGCGLQSPIHSKHAVASAPTSQTDLGTYSNF